MSMLIGRLAEDGFVALLQYLYGEFEFCEKQEGCLHVLAFIKLKCEMKKALKSRLVNC